MLLPGSIWVLIRLNRFCYLKTWLAFYNALAKTGKNIGAFFSKSKYSNVAFMFRISISVSLLKIFIFVQRFIKFLMWKPCHSAFGLVIPVRFLKLRHQDSKIIFKRRTLIF